MNFWRENSQCETFLSDFQLLCDSMRLEAWDVDWSIISKSQFCISSIWQMNFSLAMNAIWREKSTWTTKARILKEREIHDSESTREKRRESVSAAKKSKKICRLCYKQEIWCAVQKINWYPGSEILTSKLFWRESIFGLVFNRWFGSVVRSKRNFTESVR